MRSLIGGPYLPSLLPQTTCILLLHLLAPLLLCRRRCMSKKDNWITQPWTGFNPTLTAGDDQFIIRPNGRACVGALVLGLEQATGYSFRLVAGSPGGTSYSKITQPILTRGRRYFISCAVRTI